MLKPRRYLALLPDATMATRVARTVDALGLPGDVATDAIASVVTSLGLAGIETHHTGRTERLPSTFRTELGAVPVYRTMHRCTCAADVACACVQSYPMLDGAPVGAPESLDAARAELRAIASDAAWALRNVRAEAGTLQTRAQRRNAKLAERRARKAARP